MMEIDQGTLIARVITGITGIAGLVIAGFIGFKIIQALAAFVDAFQGQHEPSGDDKNGQEEQ